MPPVLAGGRELSYTYTRDDEKRIRRDALIIWLWAFDVVLIVTLITVAVIAITGGRA